MKRTISYILIYCIMLLGMCLEGFQIDSAYVSVCEESAEVRSNQNITSIQDSYDKTTVLRTESVKLLSSAKKMTEQRMNRQILFHVIIPEKTGNLMTVFCEEGLVENISKHRSHAVMLEYVHRQDGKA